MPIQDSPSIKSTFFFINLDILQELKLENLMLMYICQQIVLLLKMEFLNLKIIFLINHICLLLLLEMYKDKLLVKEPELLLSLKI